MCSKEKLENNENLIKSISQPLLNPEEKYCLKCNEISCNEDHPERENYCSNCGHELILAKDKDFKKFIAIASDLRTIRFIIFDRLLPKLNYLPRTTYLKQFEWFCARF